jgi:uroporphyrinogen-III decarboxylase
MNSYERFTARLKDQPVDRVPNLDIFMTRAAHHIGQPLSRYYLDHHVLVDANLAVAADFSIDLLQAISDPYREAADFGLEVDFPEDNLPLNCKPLILVPDEGKEYPQIPHHFRGWEITMISKPSEIGYSLR